MVTTDHAVDGRIQAIEVFWRPGCPFSDALGRGLDRVGVPMHRRNIWENPDDAAIVRSIADGNETVPTIIIGPVALVNPSVGLVLATVARARPAPPRRPLTPSPMAASAARSDAPPHPGRGSGEHAAVGVHGGPGDDPREV